MLVCTSLLRPGPARIGSLGKNVHLPRSVQVNVAIATVLTAIPGLIAGSVLTQLVGGGITTIAVGGATGAMLGYVLVSWSPYRRESLLRVLQVVAASRQGRVSLLCDGVGHRASDVTADVGTCPSCQQEVPVKPDGTTKRHDIRRKVYVGLCPLPEVIVGEVTMVPSMIDLPVDRPEAA